MVFMERVIVNQSVELARDMMEVMIRRNFPHDKETIEACDKERKPDCFDVALEGKRHSQNLKIS